MRTIKINVPQKYNRKRDNVFLQMLNGCMKKMFYRIAGFCMLAICGPACIGHAQKLMPKTSEKLWLPAKKYTLADPDRKPPNEKNELVLNAKNLRMTTLPATSFSTGMQNLGWGSFCFAEYRFRQTTKIPLYVRLGSVEQTNRLEGK